MILKPSRLHHTLLAIGTTLSLGCIIYTSHALAPLAILLVFLYATYQQSNNPALIAIQQDDHGYWQLKLKSGKVLTGARLSPNSTVTSWVAVLTFSLSEQRRPITCMIFRDSLGGGLGEYKKLMVALFNKMILH